MAQGGVAYMFHTKIKYLGGKLIKTVWVYNDNGYFYKARLFKNGVYRFIHPMTRHTLKQIENEAIL